MNKLLLTLLIASGFSAVAQAQLKDDPYAQRNATVLVQISSKDEKAAEDFSATSRCAVLAHTNYTSSTGGSACVSCSGTLVNVTWTTSSSGNVYQSEIVSSIHSCSPGGHR